MRFTSGIRCLQRATGGLFVAAGAAALLTATSRAQFADACNAAPTVGLGTFGFNLASASAGSTAFTPSCAGNHPATIDQWVRFIPSVTGPVSISTVGLSGGDTVLSLHDASFGGEFDCAFAPFAVLACNDDAGGPQSRVVVNLQAGQNVLVRIAGADDSRPSGSVAIETFIPLAGDDCASAAEAVTGENVYDATAMVVNSFVGSCFGYRDQFFTYTPAVSGALRVENCGQPTQASFTVLSTCDGRVLGCSEYGECFVGTAVQAGVPVIIRVANDQAEGPETFTIILDADGIPSNDACETPETAVVGLTAFDNTYATDGVAVHCSSGGGFEFAAGLDVWFSFVAPVTGVYDIGTEQSEGISDTVLAIYDACGSSPLACNNDARGFLSFIRTPLTGGQTYLIQVSGAGLADAGTPTDRGAGVLSIRRSIAPVNDECSTATTVVAGETAFDHYDATTGVQVPSCLPAGMTTVHDIWFRYVPTTNGPVEATILPGSAPSHLSVFDFSCEDVVSLATAGNYYNPADGSDSPSIIVDGEAGVPILLRVAESKLSNDPDYPRGDGRLYVGPATRAVIVNDECVNAIPLPLGETSISLVGSIKDCSSDPGPQFDNCAAVTDNDIFYRFVAASSGAIEIVIVDGVDYPNFDGLVVSVYSSCGGAPIAKSLEYGDAPIGTFIFDVLEGSEYLVRVGSILRFGSLNVQTGSIIVRTTVRCDADFNGDGFLDFFDYDDFVNCFETGACPPGKTADFNGDAFVDFFDYDAFVGVFESGC